MVDRQAEAPEHFRRIRSFVRREGRLTPAQSRALEELMPSHGWKEDVLQPAEGFGREAFTVLEIGFGAGEGLLAQCQQFPERNFLGLEVHRPGVGGLLHRMEERGIENLRVSSRDAVEFLDHNLAAESIDRIQVWFPDPWHKKRHHKRRIIQAANLDRMARVLKPQAEIWLATDWANYAEWMMEALEAHPEFENMHGPQQFAPRCTERIVTRFEARGLRLGHDVFDLAFQKTS